MHFANRFLTTSKRGGEPSASANDKYRGGSSACRLANNFSKARPKHSVDLSKADPFELGILHALNSNKSAKRRRKPDARLPLAVKSQLRKKRLKKHRFDDASEAPKIKRKKQRVIIIIDSDDEEEDTVQDMAVDVSKTLNKPTTRFTPSAHPKDAAVPQPSKYKDLQINTVAPTEAMKTTARVVTPASEEDMQPQSTVTRTSSDMDALQERLAKSFVGKPRKNRIRPESIYADAVNEIEEEDDDSVGSGMGAAVRTTGKPQAPPLWEVFCEQQEKEPLKELPPQEANKKERSFGNPGGYETFDMFKDFIEVIEPSEASAINQSSRGDSQSHRDEGTVQEPYNAAADEKFLQVIRSKRANAKESGDGNRSEQNAKLQGPAHKKAPVHELRDLSDEDRPAEENAGARMACIEILDDESDVEMVDERNQERTKTSECVGETQEEKSSSNSLDDDEDLQPVEQSTREGPPHSSQSPTEENLQVEHAELDSVVTDTSDSEGCSFTFTEESEVGICERICKDDDMKAEVMKFRAHNETATKGPYSLDTFKALWERAEDCELCFTAQDVEDSNDFRRANRSVQKHDSEEQGQAQYGRILPEAMEKLFREVMQLQSDSIFVDLGHGIGNTCMQASYTVGCHSKGIELVDARYFTSEALHRCLAKMANEKRGEEPSDYNRSAGLIELRHGRLENPAYHEWLTEQVHHVFVNNFADVMGSRSAPKKGTIPVDSRIAAMFANMKPGSVMVTLHPLDALGLPRGAVLDHRRKHKMQTPVKTNASFFSVEEIELGPANVTVSWSEGGGCDKTIKVYKYTRFEQPQAPGAVFLCTNHGNCERAESAEPIPATANGTNGLVMKACECKFAAIGTRGKKKVKY